MRVMLLGATGLTGGKVLQGLLGREEVSQVVALVRHKLPTLHDKLAQHEVDFDRHSMIGWVHLDETLEAAEDHD